MELKEKIEIAHHHITMLRNEIKKRVVGQENLLNHILMALISNGHILLEGYPGLAKTLTIETLSKIVDLSFKRIQFTPDLLPSDLIGTMIFNPSTSSFHIEKGPIFTHFLMADEINRAPAKVQSALLESMQERNVTIQKETFKLEEPFFVMATQNPIEQEGTYELPEAQKDRFMFKVNVPYPNEKEELEIINRIALSSPSQIHCLISKEQLFEWRETRKEIYIDEKIKKYIIRLVMATRKPTKTLDPLIKLGVSPRASIYLTIAAQSHALLEKRDYVVPDDVKAVATSILAHRLQITYEALAENMTAQQIVLNILEGTPLA